MTHSTRFSSVTHLEISELQSGRALRYGARGLSQSPTGLLLPLSCDHLRVNVFCKMSFILAKKIITLALASLAASASAAMALWS